MSDVAKPKIAKSDELWARATQIIPAGTQTFSKGPSQFVDGVAPKYLDRAEGCYVWDVDGNKYIDYAMACQPIILGYRDPDVDKAIIDQLGKGITFSLMHPLEIEVTERLIEMIPCAEAVRFGKNGADATSIAIRISRSVTGREHLAYCGYHGWHDWYIANTDRNEGIPAFNQTLSHSFTYNDLASLARVFESHEGQIACAILEPASALEPAPGFLEGVKEICHDNGALVVYDEIITGFRWAEGGAQERYGVLPDLACFAKGLSNGMPLSAIVGRKEYMKVLGENTFFSFTYGGECLSLAAARATTDKIRREKVIDRLWRIGAKLQDGFNDLAAQHGLEDFVRCIGVPCRTILAFDGQDRLDALEIKSLFIQEIVKRGVLCCGFHAICAAHGEPEVEMTLAAYDGAMRLFRSVLDKGQAIAGVLEGKPVEPVLRKIVDFQAQARLQRR